jgi:hypothetical protein
VRVEEGKGMTNSSATSRPTAAALKARARGRLSRSCGLEIRKAIPLPIGRTTMVVIAQMARRSPTMKNLPAMNSAMAV